MKLAHRIQILYECLTFSNIVVQQIDVDFSEPIDITSLDVSDLTLTRDGDTENLLAGDTRVTFEDRGDNRYRIGGINWVQAFIAAPQIASFTLTVNASGISDLAGNAATGLLSSTWTIDLDKPQPLNDLQLSTFNGLVQNGQIPSKQVQVAGTLAEPGLTIAIRDMTTGTDLIRQTIPGTTFALPIAFASPGQHRLRIRQIDPAGNTTDEFLENLFIQETLPFVESTSGLPSGPSGTALDTFTVTFVTPVNASQVLPTALRLTWNGGANLIDAGVSVTPQADGRTFVFSGLSGLTAADGRYELRLLLDQIVSAKGIAGSGEYVHAWKKDSTAPTSSLSLLPLRQSLSTFVLNVSGTDPALSPIVPGSGISAYDIYMAVDQNPFVLWQTLSGEQPTIAFSGDANSLYSFRSVARDAAGNVENKPNQVDAFTYVPDLIPPVTNVTNVDTALSRFKIDFSGTDIGRDLKTFDVFVQIDGGEVQRIARVTASAADANGTYHGTAEYQSLTDGVPHTYRIFTLGIDGSQNTEEAPNESKGIVLTASYDEPTPPTSIDLDVQKGADSRSYVRYLDVNLHHAALASDLAATLQDADLGNDRIRLRRFETDGSGTGEVVDLNGYVSAVDQTLAFDFGPPGLGSAPRSNQVDGYYQLSLDLDGDGSFDKDHHFFRLLGDVEGDGDVDVFDQLMIRRAMGQFGSGLPADADGDENVNSLDLRLVALNNGNQIDKSLPLDD